MGGIFQLIAYGAQDYNYPPPTWRDALFGECVNHIRNELEENFVEAIDDDLQEHNQAYVRWLLHQVFIKYTGTRFKQIASLVLRYLPFVKKPVYRDRHYYEFELQCPQLKNEPQWAHVDRVIYMFSRLMPSITYHIRCKGKLKNKILNDIRKYFTIEDTKEKIKHIEACEKKYKKSKIQICD
jgi:hypothetical protein